MAREGLSKANHELLMRRGKRANCTVQPRQRSGGLIRGAQKLDAQRSVTEPPPGVDVVDGDLAPSSLVVGDCTTCAAEGLRHLLAGNAPRLSHRAEGSAEFAVGHRSELSLALPIRFVPALLHRSLISPKTRDVYMPYAPTIRERLRARRHALGWSLDDVCAAVRQGPPVVGFHRTSLRAWEQPESGRSPNPEQLTAWARALDLELVMVELVEAARHLADGDPPTSPAVRGARRRAA